MPDPAPPRVIRSAFPHVPEAGLAGMLGGLSPDDSLDALLGSADFCTVREAVADWMLRNPTRGIGTTLPGLWLARDRVISTAELPLRVGTGLARLGISVWGELLDLPPTALLDGRGFGEGSLRPLLAEAVRVAAAECARQAPPARPPTVDSFEGRCPPPRPPYPAARFRRLVDWAVAERGAATVDDLFAAAARSPLPDDIAELCRAVGGTRLADLFPGMARPTSLEAAVDDLCGVLDRRSRTIFLARIALDRRRTLEDLGAEFGVSRERVRQIEGRAADRVREALAAPRFAPVGWRAHTLKTGLGVAVPAGVFYGGAVADVLHGVSAGAREYVRDVLLWVAGPYSWDAATGWLRAGDLPGPEAVAAFADDQGRVDMPGLQVYLAGVGLRPAVQPAWRDQVGNLKNVGGCWLVWSGSLADKAARLLASWGRPATPDEIVAAVGEGHAIRASRTQLYEDERFVRVDMTHVGLRTWGLDEYSTITDEIDQEIHRRGGSAGLDEVVAALVGRFDLREASVRQLAHAPMFVVAGGTVRRRTPADPHGPVPPVTATAGCYLLGPDALAWRVEVTAESMRGSGRAMPAPVAAWLGVSPGGRRVLAAEGGSVTVSWPETSARGPAYGSIRFFLDRLGGRCGDQLLLVFRRDAGTVAAVRISPEAVGGCQGLDRVSLLTGVPPGAGGAVFLDALGAALGTDGTAAAVTAALRERGEATLAALVSAGDDPPGPGAATAAPTGLLF